LTQSLLDALSWLQNRGINPRSVILYGRSIGSYPTLSVLCQYSKQNISFAGVLLQSPLSCPAHIFHLPLDVGFLNNIKMARDISDGATSKICIVFVHGTADTILALHHSEKLFCLLDSEQIIRYLVKVEGGDHNNLEKDFYPYLFQSLQVIIEFSNKEKAQEDSEMSFY